MKRYELLSHDADIKIRAYGKNEEEAFSNSLTALKETISDKKKFKKEVLKKIEISAKSKEELLYKFLEEIIFILDSKKLIISEIKKIKIKENLISLEAYFQKIEKLNNPVKAITYSQILIKKEKEKFIFEFTLDL